MLTKNKLRLFLFSLMIGLLLIGCVYLISIFHKLDFVESNLLKFKAKYLQKEEVSGSSQLFWWLLA